MSALPSATLSRAHVSQSTVDRLREERGAWKSAAERADSDVREMRKWLRFLVAAALATGFGLGLAARTVALMAGWWK